MGSTILNGCCSPLQPPLGHLQGRLLSIRESQEDTDRGSFRGSRTELVTPCTVLCSLGPHSWRTREPWGGGRDREVLSRPLLASGCGLGNSIS